VTTTCALLVSALWLTSCAGNSSVKPPLTLAPRANDAASFQSWVIGVVDAYVRNCLTLSVMRGEDPARCQQP